jgi:hypothetical protein
MEKAGGRNLFLVCLHPMTQVGSLRMCLDPYVVPPLAGFLILAVLGVFHHILSVASVCSYKLLTVFDLFISPGTMFQASTTLFEKKFLLVSSFAACGLVNRISGPVSIGPYPSILVEPDLSLKTNIKDLKLCLFIIKGETKL